MIKVAGPRLTRAARADGFRAKILRSLNVAAFRAGKGFEGGLAAADFRVVGPCHPLQYKVCIPLRSAGRRRS